MLWLCSIIFIVEVTLQKYPYIYSIFYLLRHRGWTKYANINLFTFILGGRNSAECTLILTEGDSAKTLAVSGLGVVGRDKYGVFPLRGKMLNVREASHKQVEYQQLLFYN